MEEAARCLKLQETRNVYRDVRYHINIPDFIARSKRRKLSRRLTKVISESSALPAVCGRVCPQESQCEGKCIRGIKGEPVSIGKLERFVADWARENGIKPAAAGRRRTATRSLLSVPVPPV